MKGNTTVIKHLNQVLTNELTAINQYFIHSKMFGNWGFDRLAKRERAASGFANYQQSQLGHDD